jgi:hypothetical protein
VVYTISEIGICGAWKKEKENILVICGSINSYLVLWWVVFIRYEET